MKTNNWKRLLRSMTCLLLALVLFTGMAAPAFAASDGDENESGTTSFGLSGDKSSTEATDTAKDENHDPFQYFTTSTDATVVKESHLAREWGELDWSVANDGFVKVKINKLTGPNMVVYCNVGWYDIARSEKLNKSYSLKTGDWTIPLPAGSPVYAVSLNEHYTCCEHNMTKEEKARYNDLDRASTLCAKFEAEIIEENNQWAISTPDVNYAGAEKVCEKALEITKNCKTEAEKITAVFNWVSKNIKYDNAWAKELDKAGKNESVSCVYDEKNGAHKKTPTAEEYGYKTQFHIDLDMVLAKKKGICNHMATLMAGMLRSIGVPCKVITGTMNDEGHAWVAVNPRTGTLDLKKLGAGKDYEPALPGEEDNLRPTGWIRLDPTNASVPQKTSNDANYSVKESH